MKTRLNKLIADSGYCSRRQADRLISDGQVTINGRKAKLGETATDTDVVEINGQRIDSPAKKHTYLMLNKPVGFISTTDESKKDNVISFVGHDKRLFPVGRLDVASSGLLLLTDDGEMANRLSHPRYGHEKEYFVRTDQAIEEDQLKQLATGVFLDDGKTKPTIIEQTGKKDFVIILKEGRNRQVRRMCEAVGLETRGLKRIRTASLKLGSLKEGDVRNLTKSEVKTLRKICKLDR
jgi:23S rRNA pseudouridine2604 synthase